MYEKPSNCLCSDADLEKFGASRRTSGGPICNNCNAPVHFRRLLDFEILQTESGVGLKLKNDRPHGTKPATIPSRFISSTPSIAGFEIVKHCGLVTELSSASGWTAKSKGNNALDKAIFGFVDTAVELGANAVVSVTISTFGAGGGITSIVGGDAVGVLITGTAVVVQPIET